MKANELRIGNYVKLPYGVEDVVNVGDPEGGGDTVNGYRIEKCKPIPLTEEWLIKFGFEKTSLHYLKKDGFIIQSEKDYFECFLGNVVVKLQYLHQLQNLYFALTGGELQINI